MFVSTFLVVGFAAASVYSTPVLEIDDSWTAVLLKRQAPGTPAYECHSSCGNAITLSRGSDPCTDSTFLEDYAACLACAGPDKQNIWRYYGGTLSTAGAACGLSTTPVSGSSASETSAATSATPVAATETTSTTPTVDISTTETSSAAAESAATTVPESSLSASSVETEASTTSAVATTEAVTSATTTAAGTVGSTSAPVATSTGGNATITTVPFTGTAVSVFSGANSLLAVMGFMAVFVL